MATKNNKNRQPRGGMTLPTPQRDPQKEQLLLEEFQEKLTNLPGVKEELSGLKRKEPKRISMSPIVEAGLTARKGKFVYLNNGLTYNGPYHVHEDGFMCAGSHDMGYIDPYRLIVLKEDFINYDPYEQLGLNKNDLFEYTPGPDTRSTPEPEDGDGYTEWNSGFYRASGDTQPDGQMNVLDIVNLVNFTLNPGAVGFDYNVTCPSFICDGGSPEFSCYYGVCQNGTLCERTEQECVGVNDPPGIGCEEEGQIIVFNTCESGQCDTEMRWYCRDGSGCSDPSDPENSCDQSTNNCSGTPCPCHPCYGHLQMPNFIEDYPVMSCIGGTGDCLDWLSTYYNTANQTAGVDNLDEWLVQNGGDASIVSSKLPLLLNPTGNTLNNTWAVSWYDVVLQQIACPGYDDPQDPGSLTCQPGGYIDPATDNCSEITGTTCIDEETTCGGYDDPQDATGLFCQPGGYINPIQNCADFTQANDGGDDGAGTGGCMPGDYIDNDLTCEEYNHQDTDNACVQGNLTCAEYNHENTADACVQGNLGCRFYYNEGGEDTCKPPDYIDPDTTDCSDITGTTCIGQETTCGGYDDPEDPGILTCNPSTYLEPGQDCKQYGDCIGQETTCGGYDDPEDSGALFCQPGGYIDPTTTDCSLITGTTCIGEETTCGGYDDPEDATGLFCQPGGYINPDTTNCSLITGTTCIDEESSCGDYDDPENEGEQCLTCPEGSCKPDGIPVDVLGPYQFIGGVPSNWYIISNNSGADVSLNGTLGTSLLSEKYSISFAQTDGKDHASEKNADLLQVTDDGSNVYEGDNPVDGLQGKMLFCEWGGSSWSCLDLSTFTYYDDFIFKPGQSFNFQPCRTTGRDGSNYGTFTF